MVRIKSYENLQQDFENLTEGVYDRGIFKAFFIAGGPGSGKSFVARKTTGGLNLKVINSDDAFERGLDRAGLSRNIADLSPEEYDRAMDIRKSAKDVTKLKQELAIEGRLGLVIDGTGKDIHKIERQKKALELIGYDTFLLFVNTSLDVAMERNRMRQRVVPIEIVKKSWEEVQENIGGFQTLFGQDNFMIVDNNNATEDVLTKVWKRISKVIDRPVENYLAKRWIQKQLDMKDRR